MIFRIDVSAKNPSADPLGQAVRHQIQEFGTAVGPISTTRVFLIDSDAGPAAMKRVAEELLADPVVETAQLVTAAPADTGRSRIEIHLKPGVMDPVAASTEMAIRDMGIDVKEVRTGRAFLIEGALPKAELQRIASRVLANGVIESVHFDAFIPKAFPAGHSYEFRLKHVPLVKLTDEQLVKLSREGHLFLSLAEMKAIQDYFRKQDREPTDVELETIAQTWSEHCVHKTLKSGVELEIRDESGKVVETRRYGNLIRDTIFKSTMELMAGDDRGFCLSVFADNAGVIAFDETDAVCFKVETHNHPSAIEPYGGSATGIGGVIRDVLGTGLAAKPVANTDVFCVAYPTAWTTGANPEIRNQNDESGGEDLTAKTRRDEGESQKSEIRNQNDESSREDLTAKTRRDEGGNQKSETRMTNQVDKPEIGNPRSALEIASVSSCLRGESFSSIQNPKSKMECGSAGASPSQSAIRNPQSAIGTIQNLPKGVIHPKRILQQVVAGVRDYGNRMGIPTVNGAVYFDDRYLGNPLVFCGCVGLIPRDKIHKETREGDYVVVMGGRTGRDGIHGATFSSAELTDTHADEFSHAVQIGNAITEKKVTDVVLQARDRGLFTAITDCGAGGLSSAVGEMGEKLGAAVELDKVPLKYAGLRHDEIWISEAQERMVLSVPPEKVDELLKLAAGEDVEATVIGRFGTPNSELLLTYNGQQVARISMDFLHKGIPMGMRKAVATVGKKSGIRNPNDESSREDLTAKTRRDEGGAVKSEIRDQNDVANPKSKIQHPKSSSIQNPKSKIQNLKDRLLATLSHPNIASKHWIIRQYDHEVQGGSVIKPLTGQRQVGPSDAAVIRPKLGSTRGVALGCGMVPSIEDPYAMAIASIDEALRNVVAVGANLGGTAILDNFCWPSVDDERTMGALARTCEACYDAAKAYGVPFISGKDSLHNQFTNQETGQVIRIPNTLLISAISVIDDVRRCITMDLKDPREGQLVLIGPAGDTLPQYAAVHRTVADAIRRELVLACHDVSDGGYLTAVAEMCIASGFGAKLTGPAGEGFFAEPNATYMLEVHAQAMPALQSLCKSGGVNLIPIGRTTPDGLLQVARLLSDRSEAIDLHASVDELTAAWRGTLDW